MRDSNMIGGCPVHLATTIHWTSVESLQMHFKVVIVVRKLLLNQPVDSLTDVKVVSVLWI